MRGGQWGLGVGHGAGWMEERWMAVGECHSLTILSASLLHSHHLSPLPLPRSRSIFRCSALFVAYSEELPVFASPYPGF